MNAEEKKSLIASIERAWKDVPYPGDGNIFTPDSYDDEDITRYFSGTTWQGHSVRELRAHATAISAFFTPAAFQYWLPAYLIAAIEDPDELSQGVESLISSFVPDSESAWFREVQARRLALMTNKQKQIVITVLEHLASDEPTESLKSALKWLYEATSYA